MVNLSRSTRGRNDNELATSTICPRHCNQIKTGQRRQLLLLGFRIFKTRILPSMVDNCPVLYCCCPARYKARSSSANQQLLLRRRSRRTRRRRSRAWRYFFEGNILLLRLRLRLRLLIFSSPSRGCAG